MTDVKRWDYLTVNKIKPNKKILSTNEDEIVNDGSDGFINIIIIFEFIK